MIEPIQKAPEDALISGRAYNRLADLANMLRLNGALTVGPSGSSLNPPHRVFDPTLEPFLAVIVAAGPLAEIEPTNNTYWVKSCKITNVNGQTDRDRVTLDEKDNSDESRLFVKATNLEENATGSHLVPLDTFVWVKGITDSYGVRRWEFTQSLTDILFAVRVVKDGGAQASTCWTAPTWTYTLKTLLPRNVTLATAKSPQRPRQNNPHTQAADNSIGWAYYDSGTLKLWDCQETPTTLEGGSAVTIGRASGASCTADTDTWAQGSALTIHVLTGLCLDGLNIYILTTPMTFDQCGRLTAAGSEVKTLWTTGTEC